MVNFTGIYSHNIDSKGRIAVPAKFREALGDTFEVTNGLDGCLFVFTSENSGYLRGETAKEAQ